MRARDIMTKGTVSIADSATIYEAAELMVGSRVSGLPVLDASGILVGIISEAAVFGVKQFWRASIECRLSAWR